MMKRALLVAIAAGNALLTSCAHFGRSPPAIRGERGRAVKLMGLDGRETDLAAVGAPVTFVVLWATFCQPCLEELPKVEELARLYANDRDVAIVGLAIDPVEDLAKVAAVKKQLGLSFPVYVGRMEDVAKLEHGPSGHGRPAVAGAVPMLLVADAKLNVFRELGYDGDDYVRRKQGLIEQARAGKLPARTQRPRMSEPEREALRLSVKKKYPELPQEKIDSLVKAFDEAQ